MKILTCNFNLYDLHQSIYLIDEETETMKKLCICTVDEIGNHMAQLASQLDINKIHLYGNNEYVNDIVNKIQSSNYNSNNIKIEVN